MAKTAIKNSVLSTQIQNSLAVKTLTSSYQAALAALALSPDQALQHNLEKILIQENPNDLQSLYFTEETLEQFVEENHLESTSSDDQLRFEFSKKAEKLIRTFLFFDNDQKDKLIPPLKTLPLEGLKAIISELRQGHRKQSEYLDVFVEKDPKVALKFELIASGQDSRGALAADHRAKNQPQK
jgi:hypothetical protein